MNSEQILQEIKTSEERLKHASSMNAALCDAARNKPDRLNALREQANSHAALVMTCENLSRRLLDLRRELARAREE